MCLSVILLESVRLNGVDYEFQPAMSFSSVSAACFVSISSDAAAVGSGQVVVGSAAG